MSIEISGVSSNPSLAGIGRGLDVDFAKASKNAAEPLFSDALIVKESENFALGDMGEIDMDELEKELVRDDKLGKLFSSVIDYPTPEMPVFV